MLQILPIVLVYEIFSYMPWSSRTKLITRGWLKKQLRRRTLLVRWKSKVRIYSYIKVFGQTFSCCSWPRFCQITLGLHRRTRNRHYRLTWKSAANDYFKNRCKGCGKKARAHVFGWNICLDCRRNPRLPECFMVSVGEARSRGVPKRILDTVPWHGSIMGRRLRFWKEIQQKLV